MDVHWAWRPPRIRADSKFEKHCRTHDLTWSSHVAVVDLGGLDYPLLALLVRLYLYTISGLSSDLEHL
jgi:hypothetical protein